MSPKGSSMRKILCLAASLLLPVLLTSPVSAQTYTISKSVIAGGGALNSTGGVYAVSGTIGQHDAGTPLSGGSSTLVGGFWALPGAVQTPGAPLLSVEQLAGSSVRVYWPLPATGFVLEQSLSLASPPATNPWSQVAFPYQTNATHISLTVSAPAAARYYRLRKP